MEIQEHQFIRNVSNERKDRLIERAEILELKDGEIVFKEGSESDALFLILDGSVSFLKNNDHEVNVSTADSYFGEIGIITKEPRGLTARAKGPTRLARIPGDVLSHLLIDGQDPLGNIIASLIRHLQSTTRHYISEIEKQEKLALVGMMMSSVLHDFRNPFNLIVMATHLIRRKAKNGDEIERFCETIDKQLERMTQMMDDIIAFSIGKDSLETEELELSAFGEILRENCTHLLNKERIAVSIEFGKGTFRADLNKLIRALLNLLSNAVDAIKGSERPGYVSATGRLDGEGYVVFQIEDDGPGIPEEIRDRFFEPFVTFRKKGGTGLGSAITKSFIEAHQGEVTFTSIPNRGTTFNIRIPTATTDSQKLETQSH